MTTEQTLREIESLYNTGTRREKNEAFAMLMRQTRAAFANFDALSESQDERISTLSASIDVLKRDLAGIESDA